MPTTTYTVEHKGKLKGGYSNMNQPNHLQPCTSLTNTISHKSTFTKSLNSKLARSSSTPSNYVIKAMLESRNGAPAPHIHIQEEWQHLVTVGHQRYDINNYKKEETEGY